MQNDKDKIRLLMNSNQAKEIKSWLLDGMLFDFRFVFWKVSIWDSFPFVCFHKNTGGRTQRPLDASPDTGQAQQTSKGSRQ